MARDEFEVDESRVKFIKSGAEYYDYYNLPNSDEGAGEEELGVEPRYNGGGGDLFASYASKGGGVTGTGYGKLTGVGGSGLGLAGATATGGGVSGLGLRSNKLAQRRRKLMLLRRKRRREKMRLKRLKQQLLQEQQLLQDQQLLNGLQQQGLQEFQQQQQHHDHVDEHSHNLVQQGLQEFQHHHDHVEERGHGHYGDGFSSTGVSMPAMAAALVQNGLEGRQRQRSDDFADPIAAVTSDFYSNLESNFGDRTGDGSGSGGLRYDYADHKDDLMDNNADRSARISGFRTSPRRMGLGSGLGDSGLGAGLGLGGGTGLSGLGATALAGTALRTGVLGDGSGAKFDNGLIGSRRRKAGRGRLGGGGGVGGLLGPKSGGSSLTGFAAGSGLGVGLGSGLGATGLGTGLSGLGGSVGLSGSGLGAAGLGGKGLNRAVAGKLHGGGNLGLTGLGAGGGGGGGLATHNTGYGLSGLGGTGLGAAAGISRNTGHGHSGSGYGGGHSGLGGPVIVLRKKGADQEYDGLFDDITNNLFGNGILNYETFAALIVVASVISGIVIVNAINGRKKRKRRNLSDDMFAVSSFLEFVHKGRASE